MADTIISGIYRIRNTVNGRCYIGSSMRIQRRWHAHRTSLRGNKHHSVALQRAWNKYGEPTFIFEIVEAVPDKHNLIDREQHWINHHSSASGHGYNSSPTAGSPLGVKHSEASKAKSRLTRSTPEFKAAWSAKMRGRKHTPEALAIFREAMRKPEYLAKRKAWAAGRKMPKEALAKAIEANRKRSISDEHKKRLIDARIAFGTPDATREKMRKSHLGKKHTPEHIAKTAAANRGKIRSPEIRQKLRVAQSQVVLSDEERRRRSKVFLSIMKDPATRAKMSATRKAMGAEKRAIQNKGQGEFSF